MKPSSQRRSPALCHGFYHWGNVFSHGLLAELLVRIYYESQNKPTYMISYSGAEQGADGLSRASEPPRGAGVSSFVRLAGRADLMCGICGFVGSGSGETLERMSILLRHRGPTIRDLDVRSSAGASGPAGAWPCSICQAGINRY